jgi:crossover junction endodeoxyribonuclease RusA
MRLELPWPPATLTPNAKRRTHWRVYSKDTASYRNACAWLARSQGAKASSAYLHLRITFHPPDNRKRDLDGMLGQFKAGIDGLSDALGVDDSGWSLSIARGDKAPGGQIIVEISERDAQ